MHVQKQSSKNSSVKLDLPLEELFSFGLRLILTYWDTSRDSTIIAKTMLFVTLIKFLYHGVSENLVCVMLSIF